MVPDGSGSQELLLPLVDKGINYIILYNIYYLGTWWDTFRESRCNRLRAAPAFSSIYSGKMYPTANHYPCFT